MSWDCRALLKRFGRLEASRGEAGALKGESQGTSEKVDNSPEIFSYDEEKSESPADMVSIFT